VLAEGEFLLMYTIILTVYEECSYLAGKKELAGKGGTTL
jgi:hypothetical protein